MSDPIVRYVKLTRDDKLGYGLTIVTLVYQIQMKNHHPMKL